MFPHRVERGFEKIGGADAGNLDGVLERKKDSLARAQLRAHGQEIFAAVKHFPAGNFVIFPSRQNMRERALPRTIRSHDRMHFAGTYMKIDATQDFRVSNICPKAANIQHANTFRNALPFKQPFAAAP